MNFPSNYEQLSVIIAFIVPGYIIGAVRSRFIAGRWGQNPQTLAVESILYSILFFCVFSPIVENIFNEAELTTVEDASIRAIIFVFFPILFGILLGLEAYYDCLFNFLRRIGISVVHNMPTAWDYKFGRFQSSRAIVTLKDDTVYLAFLGGESSFSTDKTERDIYIDCLYDEEEDCWQKANKSLYIAADQIKTIEFIEEEEEMPVNEEASQR